MTVIAFDGRTLAADRLADCNGARRTVTKIQRIDGALIGGAGNMGRVFAMVEWFRRGAVPADFPSGAADNNWAVLLVVKDGRAVTYEQSPWPLEFKDRQIAIGSGRDFAMAAMHLGQDARGAVEVAIDLCPSCGGGVDVLEVA